VRVLVVHNRYRSEAPSGENRVVDEEVTLLGSGGHAVERFEVDSDVIESFGPRQRAAVALKVVWAGDAKRDLARAIKRFEPDVVHLHNTFPLLSPSVLAATAAARVPAVATLHNYRLLCAGGTLFRDGAVCHDCLGRGPLAGVWHGCYRGSSLLTVPNAASIVVNTRRWQRGVQRFLVLSTAERELFAGAGFPRHHLVVKPNFVRDRPHQRGAAEGEHFLYLGRMAEEKGLRVLREAWSCHAPAGGHRHSLVLAGGGPLDAEMRAWAAADPSVTFLGYQPADACAQLVDHAIAVLAPSIWEETFGLVVIEAKAAGVPTIATDHASFPDLIEPSVDGLLVPPGDPAALSTALGTLDADPAAARRMGAAARASYEARYTPEANLALLERIYDEARAGAAKLPQ
jgi:glycosyltransferase involved in cell wall biosynthesis